jgi:glyoxylase-like metal-dependent hydrolase (beta-lactamase superfamily II)
MEESSSTKRFIPMTSVESGQMHEVAEDIYCLTVQIVNVCFIGTAQSWVLVDAGTPMSANVIINAAKSTFGEAAKPDAIILTHGHFDHVGTIFELLKVWDVPVFAHELELPYLTGKKDYPEPDPSVDGGMLAKISSIYPIEAIDLGDKVKILPDDGQIPGLIGWRWVHTPGHTEGHISLFRDSDRALIAGDAFITVKQESLLSVLTQHLDIHGPPRYLTPDWQEAWDSVRKLEQLKPSVAVTGHGIPVKEEWLSENLALLVKDFEKIAIPRSGKYVN